MARKARITQLHHVVPDITRSDEKNQMNVPIKRRLNTEKIIAPPMSGVPARAMKMVIDTIARESVSPLTSRTVTHTGLEGDP